MERVTATHAAKNDGMKHTKSFSDLRPPRMIDWLRFSQLRRERPSRYSCVFTRQELN